jgi:YD repeat-containing protein
MSCERQILYAYDELDRLVEVHHSNGTVVRYTYDPAGNRTAAIVAPGHCGGRNSRRLGVVRRRRWRSYGAGTRARAKEFRSVTWVARTEPA